MHKYRIKLIKTHRHLRRLYSKQKTEVDMESRVNGINIQMLSNNLHSQLFDKEKYKQSSPDSDTIKKSINHLKKQDLWNKESDILPNVKIKLPKLQGSNLREHFWNIADQQSKVYRQQLERISKSSLPVKPSQWNYNHGWTKYNVDGTFESIPYPDDEALIFDVEVCMSEGSFPTLATAVSEHHWYSWCSERLIKENFRRWNKELGINDLIPLETENRQIHSKKMKNWQERVIIGHNVSFDRSFIKEQYLIDATKLRFIDTISLHMCVSGQTGLQRNLTAAYKAGLKSKDDSKMKSKEFKAILEVSSLNNLRDVHSLYCPTSKPIDKTTRDVFVNGSIQEIREDFQNLMEYCASDVVATHEVLHSLLPLFNERFPSPVTFAGLLEMSTAYLPVNQNWRRYIGECTSTYEDLERELKASLMNLADEACQLLHEHKYKDDVWLWDLDWSTKELKMTKSKASKKPRTHSEEDVVKEFSERALEEDDEVDIDFENKFENIIKSASNLYKNRPELPGYPNWYADLCSRSKNKDNYSPGPNLISTQTRVAPKLMRLTWDGFPLHYDDQHGWGYLVPGRSNFDHVSEKYSSFPLEKFEEMFGHVSTEMTSNDLDYVETELEKTWKEIEFLALNDNDRYKFYEKLQKASLDAKRAQTKMISDCGDSKNMRFHNGNEACEDVNIPGCWFFKLPHKDGNKFRVGNPLSKDFLKQFEKGMLKTYSKAHADRVLKLSIILSYWKNNHIRILSQMVVGLNKNELPKFVTRNIRYNEDGFYGAIIPRIIFAGTVTRRAVETTWLTASNAYSNRLGSELKSLIQAPPGFHFVGADVDVQELWIASLFGDASFAKMHGSTAFGWMNLQGKKVDQTDMHSRTANLVGVSRDQAKILNYGRIYGAGKAFVERLLMQFNHKLTKEEAAEKAKEMMKLTKGYRVRKSGELKWQGGSESEMFNQLEEMAKSTIPKTPVLGCFISRALEPGVINDMYMPSRINWVIQSSAVDFLHLMLVNMKWLMETFQIKGRFSISIHDEIRYLIKSESRYEAALALQITNLFTRAMFSETVGISDLPQSVAFFSAIDVDTVLRKEVTMDCQTPSNPHGLEKGYNILPGEALDIFKILEYTNGGSFKSKLPSGTS